MNAAIKSETIINKTNSDGSNRETVILEFNSGSTQETVNDVLKHISYKVFFWEGDVEREGYDNVWFKIENGEYKIDVIYTHDHLSFKY